MLVLGATSLLNVLGKRKGALRDWIVGLLAKKPARLVTVALRKQAGPDSLGDDEDRRMLPHRNVCEGVRKQFAAARRVYRFTGSSLASATKRDERHGRHRKIRNSPPRPHERKARSHDRILIVGLHQGQRTYAPHRQAGHMTAADQIVRSAKIVLAMEGPGSAETDRASVDFVCRFTRSISFRSPLGGFHDGAFDDDPGVYIFPERDQQFFAPARRSLSCAKRPPLRLARSWNQRARADSGWCRSQSQES